MMFSLSTINLPTITPSTPYFSAPPPILDLFPSLSQLRTAPGSPGRAGAHHAASPSCSWRTRARSDQEEENKKGEGPPAAKPTYSQPDPPRETLPQGRGVAPRSTHPTAAVLSPRGRASEEEQGVRSVGAWKAQPICC